MPSESYPPRTPFIYPRPFFDPPPPVLIPPSVVPPCDDIPDNDIPDCEPPPPIDVPEPGMVILLITGILTALVISRRRLKTAKK